MRSGDPRVLDDNRRVARDVAVTLGTPGTLIVRRRRTLSVSAPRTLSVRCLRTLGVRCGTLIVSSPAPSA